MQAPDNTLLVVTNPLHFVYYNQTAQPLGSIGSSEGVVADYAKELGYSRHTSLESDNSAKAIITAHQQQTGSENNRYIAWRAVDTDAEVMGPGFEIADKLEHKAFLRSLLPRELFPNYRLVANKDLQAANFEDLTQALGARQLVAQIDYSTGGKGTFVLGDAGQFEAVKNDLIASGQDIVVSEYIDGESRGLQCLAAAGKIQGPLWWHKDLVAIEGVAALSIPGATHYCGAVLQNVPTEFQDQVVKIRQTVGEALIQQGFSGIFGIDIVVDPVSKKVYVIEVNPRFTAVSHLYAGAMRASGYGTDLLTAYVSSLIESGHDTQFSENFELRGDFYYLKLQNLESTPVVLNDSGRLGIYDSGLEYRRFGFGIDSLHDAGELIIIPEVRRGSVVQPGQRAFSVIGTGDPVQGKVLDEKIMNLIGKSKQKFLSAYEK